MIQTMLMRLKKRKTMNPGSNPRQVLAICTQICLDPGYYFIYIHKGSFMYYVRKQGWGMVQKLPFSLTLCDENVLTYLVV